MRSLLEFNIDITYGLCSEADSDTVGLGVGPEILMLVLGPHFEEVASGFA